MAWFIGVVLALTVLMGADSTAMAQDRCMPGGVCCAAVGSRPGGRPDRRCGTLEEFQRYAKIVCLKADAIENKNLPEAIEASSACFAANIAVQRVQQTQQANAADQQRAAEARRQLREMGVEPPDPTTFPPDWARRYCETNDAYSRYGSAQQCISAWRRNSAEVTNRSRALFHEP
jgi:hypothetical protein